jgi:hypothetical protein
MRMTGKLKLEIKIPLKKVFPAPQRTILLGGSWENRLPDMSFLQALPPADALLRMFRYERNGFAVVLEKDQEGCVCELCVYRGPTTGYELFYAPTPDRGWILSDSFREILRNLPPSRRTPSRTGFVDFLLFQHSPLPETPIEGIRRIGHGCLFEAKADGPVSQKQIRRLKVPERNLSFQEGADWIEENLENILKPLPGDCVNLLSGGVDSTLVQVLIGPGNRAAAAAIDSPEFAFETENARRSAELCSVSLEQQAVSESSLPGLIERQTALAAMPLALPQISMIASVFDLDGGFFTSGFDADALFSLPRTKRKQVQEGVSPHTFEAEGFSVSPETELVKKLFGEKEIDERLEARKAYVRNLVSEPDRISRLELGCLTSLYSSSFAVYRHLASEKGKMLFTPFMDCRLVESSLSIPLPERVYRKGVFKPVLRRILAKRLPAYPKNQEKGGSGLPRTRYCKEGPFKGYFLENPLPEFLDPEKTDFLLEPSWDSSMTVFRCIAWSAWEKWLKGLQGEEKQ